MQKELLARVLRTRISRGGYLVLHEERSRTQAANRRAVIVKFASLLKKTLAEPEERIPTRVSRAQREKRIREKKRKAGIKIIRRDRVPPEGDE